MPPKAARASARPDWSPGTVSEAALRRLDERVKKLTGTKPVRTSEIEPYRVIPSGSLEIDFASGIGGWPLGRIVELWGVEHAGKTTLAMLAVAQAQQVYPDKATAWVDMEQTFDQAWAAKLGVDLSQLNLIPNPTSAEEAADVFRDYLFSGICSIAVLDSLGSLLPGRQYEMSATEARKVGAVANIVTPLIQQAAVIARGNGTCVMIVNQVRSIIDGAPHGPKTQSAGPWAFKHGTTMRCRVARGASPAHTITRWGEKVPVSYETSVKFEKNKTSPYGRTGLVWVTNQATDRWGPVGVDRAQEATSLGIRLGVVRQGGAWYTLPSGERVNGRDSVTAYLRAHPDEVERVRELMLRELSADVATDEGAADPDEEFLDLEE